MLKNRVDLALMFKEKGFTVGAEIGVFAGQFSEILCQNIPELKLYCIDAWKVYGGYRDYKFEKTLTKAYETAKARLIPYDVRIIQQFSMNAVKEFADESLDFVYIDGNHDYKYVRQDIGAWTRKVKLGGIVSGDDYCVTSAGDTGVIRAVHDFIKEYPQYDLQVTPWDIDHPQEDNRQPQWFFIK